MTDGHVAIVTSNFWPEATGTSQTTTEFATFLAARGLDVRVATAMPYYPAWEIAPSYRGRLWSTERHAGVTIHRAWHYVSPRVSTLSRILHEITLGGLGVVPLVRALRGARVAFVMTPDLSFAWLGLAVARLLGVRRVLVVKDVMPDAAIELGMLTNPLMLRATTALARSAYRLADEIQTLGEGMRRRIGRLAPDPAAIRIVPDTIDGTELRPVPPAENRFRAQFLSPGDFAVLHTGNMGKKQDLGLLLDAADRLREERDIRFLVFGDGAAKAEFLAARAARGLEAVAHHPLQDRAMLGHMLSGADVVLVSQRPEVTDLVVPSKLLTAMCAGAMIVAAASPDSETARLVRESGGGIVIPASDAAAFVDALRRIRAGEVDTAACRAKARSFALATFGREQVYGPIAEELGGGRATAPGHEHGAVDDRLGAVPSSGHA